MWKSIFVHTVSYCRRFLLWSCYRTGVCKKTFAQITISMLSITHLSNTHLSITRPDMTCHLQTMYRLINSNRQIDAPAFSFSFPPQTLIIGLPPAPGPAAEGVVPSEPVSTTSQKHHLYYSPKMCRLFMENCQSYKSSAKDIHLLRGPNKLLYMSKEIPRCGRAIAGRAKSLHFWQCYYISYAHSVFQLFYQYAI